MNLVFTSSEVDSLSESAQDKKLLSIIDKLTQGIRLSKEDGITLFNSQDRQTIYALANYVRKKKTGDSIFFASTLFIHPTNLCELSCQFCSFYSKPGWKNAWFLTPEEIEKKVAQFLPIGLKEVHIVGGLWRECDLNYYQDVFQRVHKLDPLIHIKALTAVEYDFLANLHQISVEEVFEKMMSWGLGSLPGGGAEILVEAIRKKIAPGKINTERYLEIHRIAHKLHLKSNISMLYGHIETPEHIIEHLDRVRCLQDETQGFKTFVPLKFQTPNNALGKRQDRLSFKDDLLIYAISRLMLDNVPNLKVLWNYVGMDTAKQILNAGGNDLGSLALEEKIATMAGGVQIKVDRFFMQELIKKMDRNPIEIHSGEE